MRSWLSYSVLLGSNARDAAGGVSGYVKEFAPVPRITPFQASGRGAAISGSGLKPVPVL